ncbi:carbohydrate esterase family 4 protein [Baudoinia panamericana UAMH 10762]|uniref:Carbohydrate esterase family 4 protein n=1 Tax=Baudoinia panamericana (strain UAMH 10762) TaxID=717646 RepID=M2MY43_BAUPA|nr:carbohydrate esterase family 4 protein [Baudoinia panamericana UAMH 10762]EMC91200.1 carbohydrate esterase family 4 protein [Baudoinia panamericana UAMH 10762]
MSPTDSASWQKWRWDPNHDTPRDLTGYGPTPPNPHWPNDAKVAISFVINYEEGGEYSVLNGDSHSETYLTETPGGDARHEARNTNAESIYDYGARAGIWRLLRVFEQARMKGTVYGVGKALEANPEATKRFLAAEWEMGSHGWRWIDYHDMSESDERVEIEKCIDLSIQQAGRAPTGWYVGRLSPRSHALIYQIYKDRGLELLWISDSYADDLPYYQPLPATVAAKYGKDEALLILPYTLDCNDFKYFTNNNWSSPDDLLNYLIGAFDELYAEGRAGEPKMMSIGLHARISGRPGRVGAVRKFVDYVSSKEGVWVATREEIARHWRREHTYQPAS